MYLVSDKLILVYFTSDAFFSRGQEGVVSGVNDYVPGDQVVAEGSWEGIVFRAHTFMSIYQLVEGTVIARTEDSLETTGGTLLLVPETKPAKGYAYEEKPLNEITVGDNGFEHLFLLLSHGSQPGMDVGPR